MGSVNEEMEEEGEARVCPMCGGINEPEAVFCANPHCHKALGEFAYVREELRREARWHETLAERVVAFIGRPHFLGIHLLWFAAWIAAQHRRSDGGAAL